jgi:predicted RNA binding protein YcfA (HicA-like mRNA interferase family)
MVKARIMCKKFKKIGWRKVRVLKNGRYRFVKGKCRGKK